jgi:hypothetical protein
MLKANFELLCKEVLPALDTRLMQKISRLEWKYHSPEYTHVHSTPSSHLEELQFSGVKSASAASSRKMVIYISLGDAYKELH